MSPESITFLRRIRDRIDRSFSLHPGFQVRFAFGIQTGFKGVNAERSKVPYDDGDPCGYIITWDLIGHWLRLKNLVRGNTHECCFIRHQTKDWPVEKGPGYSEFIEGVYATEGQEVATRSYLDELDRLDHWVMVNREEMPFEVPWGLWHGLVCLFRLARTGGLTFGMDWYTEPDFRTGHYANAFTSPEEFWKVALLQSDEPPAVFLMLPDLDARICSIEVIDELIAMSETSTDNPSAQSTTDRDATPLKVEMTPKLPIALGGPEDRPVVWGIEKKRLTPGQYRVVKLLVDLHPERLSGDQLAIRSNTEKPIGMIDRLRKDQDWADALDKPGQAHGGYGIRLRRPAKKSGRKR
jgi:hypothetical protein